MIEVELYINDLLNALKSEFKERLLYLGLQGSYLRGEATPKSDIDIVVIFDNLTITDLEVYKTVINRLPFSEKACGFICSKEDMANWNHIEICNFIHGTKDYYGNLADFAPKYSEKDIKIFIKQSVGNIYHELCHRYIHNAKEDNIKALPYIYKGVFFILQSIYYLKDGVFYPTKSIIMEHLSCEDKKILETSINLSQSNDYNFDKTFNNLFDWCQKNLSRF